MSVSVVLNDARTYTNLDYVNGEVSLDLSKPEDIEKVTVKLEGLL